MNTHPFIPEQLPLAPLQLIEASAGVGKTYSITSLYLRLVLEQELEVDKILVLSFTEAATAELRERIRTRLQAALAAYLRGGDHDDPFIDKLARGSANRHRGTLLLRKALAEIDQAAVVTIHGFCRRILQQGAFESGTPFELELVSAVDDFSDELIYDFLATVSHRDDPRLLALFRRCHGLPELRLLVTEALRHRYFPLQKGGGIEEGDGRGGLACWLAAAETAFVQARQSWQTNQREIVADLRDAGFVKKYRELIVTEVMTTRLANYLAGSRPDSFLLPPGAEILTPTHFARPDGKVCTKTAVKKGNIPQHDFFALWQDYLESLEKLKVAYSLERLSELVDFSRKELPRRLAAAGRQSFDELLYSLEQALKGPGGATLSKYISSRYPVALIDEFQDSDPVQYAIFQAIYGDKRQQEFELQRRLILIGDPKQAIYGFRGADIFAYLRAKQDCLGQLYTMTVNWRADKGMVAAVNALFANLSAPFMVPGIDFPQVRARPQAGDLWREKDGNSPLQFLVIAQALLAEISDHDKPQPARTKVLGLIPKLLALDLVRLLGGDGFLANKRLQPKDIAVLVRSNQQAAEIQEALGRVGVKAVLHSRASVFQSVEAKQLAMMLHGLLDQAGEAQRRAAMISDLLAFDHKELRALEGDEKTWRFWTEAFNRWRLLWRERGFMAMMRTIMEERAVAPRLLAHPDGQRRLTNFRHLMELLHGREREGHLQAPALVKWLDEGIANRRPGSEAEELRLESDEDAVQVLTIHRSKGLEYPVVYCPYLWTGGSRQKEEREDFFSYHDPSDQYLGKIVLLPNDKQRQQRRWEQFAEELRLLYVALTRARHCCRIIWVGASGYGESALAYLLHDDGGDFSQSAGADPGASLVDGPSAGSAMSITKPGSGSGFSPGVAPVFNLSYEEGLKLLRQRVAAEPTWGLQTLSMPESIIAAESSGLDLSPAASTVGQQRRYRQMKNPIDRSWRVGSFSQLTAQLTELYYDPGSGRDYDAASSDSGGLTPPPPAPRLPSVAASTTKLGKLAAKRLAAPITLANFPAGAGVGNLLHQIMQTISFTDTRHHQEIIEQQTRAYGFDRAKWLPQLGQALRELLATPLLKSVPWRLMDIADEQRLNEMAFVFPLCQQTEPLKATRLATFFAEFPTALPALYPEQLASLSFSAIQGYLKGFVDLVCRYQDKWYLIDYKSNLLGASYADYQPSRLSPVMSANHYILQYYIYAVALHRHLSLCLPSYDYDLHFGGVLYLFLRGMHQELGPEAGVYFELPPKKRIEGLSELLAGRG